MSERATRLAAAAVLTLAAALATARPAGAQPRGTDAARKADAMKQAEEGNRKYNVADFQGALDAYTKAYETFPAPGLLFNLGQCHRGLGNHERAVFFYERYLSEKPKAANRDIVEELLTEERGLLAKQREAEDAKRKAEEQQRAEQERKAEEERREAEHRKGTGGLVGGGGGAAAASGAGAGGGATFVTGSPAVTRDEGSGSVFKKWWFWTAVSVGVVAVAGTALYLNSQRETVLPQGTLGTLDDR